jgi:hypothetical protein
LVVSNFLENFNLVIQWMPWKYFFSDIWFLQLSIIYVLLLIYLSNNYYYIVFYFFLEVFYYGFFLSLYQLDFFVGFLWLTECLVVFVAILLLFYLNNSGNFNRLNLSLLRFFLLGGLCGLITLSFNLIVYSENEIFLPFELNINDLWDDYYESLNNELMNDAIGLMISYYSVNSFEFLMVGFILLVGSLIVVNLNKLNKNVHYPKYNTFLEIFNFFKNWVNSFFVRKQNLTDQENTYASTRIFGKK